jgi:phage terminase large subunit-like protein
VSTAPAFAYPLETNEPGEGLELPVLDAPFGYPKDGGVPAKRRWLVTWLRERARRRGARPFDFDKPFKWQEPFHEATAKEQIIIGANRMGKTHAAARKIVQLVTGRATWYKGPPGIVWCGTVSFARSVDVQRKAIRRLLADDDIVSWVREKDTKSESTLVLKSGWTIVFKAYTQDVQDWQGESVVAIWLDEEPTEMLFSEAYARTIDRRGIVIVSFTPTQGLANIGLYRRWYEPWKKFKRDHPDAKAGLVSPSVHVTTGGMQDNPLISRREIALFIESRKHRPAMIAVRVYGDWVDMSEEAIVPVDKILRFRDADVKGMEWSAIRAWIDMAFSEDDQACDMVISIGARDAMGGRDRPSGLWLLEQRGGKLDPHQRMQVVLATLKKWGDPPCNVQRTTPDIEAANRINDRLIAIGRRPVVTPYPKKGAGPVLGKVERAETFAILVAEGLVHVHEELEMFFAQAGTFPVGPNDWLDSGMGVLTRLHGRGDRLGIGDRNDGTTVPRGNRPDDERDFDRDDGDDEKQAPWRGGIGGAGLPGW